MIKLTKSLVAALVATGFMSLALHADNPGSSASHVVSFEIAPINQLSVTGSPSLLISQAVAGEAPVPVNDSTSTYAITTNQTGRKIVGQLSADMPDGVLLRASLQAPNGASSISQFLSSVPVDLVHGISTLNQTGLGINYTLSATSAAGTVTATTRLVTYTILADAD